MFERDNAGDVSLPAIATGNLTSIDAFSPQGRRQTIAEANRARQRGIRLYAIGVGPEATQDVLDQIANQPSQQHTFRVDEFQQLDDIIKRVATATCQVVAAGTGESSSCSCCRWTCRLLSLQAAAHGRGRKVLLSHCCSCKLRLRVVCAVRMSSSSSCLSRVEAVGSSPSVRGFLRDQDAVSSFR